VSEGYAPFAARLAADGLVTDPWIDGQPRFDANLLTLTAAEHAALVGAAEAVAAVHDELARIVAGEPELLASFFGLTETQRLMWALSAPAWHGVARADVFQTAGGPRCCELNCDTPSGHPEAIALSAAALLAGDAARDPNHRLERAFAGVIAAFARPVVGPDAAPVVGIIYPTEMTDDLALIALYRRWLEARGAEVVLGSPFNLGEARDGRLTVLGRPCDVLVRHYKTDWWGEREPVWLDEAPLPDPEPLVGPLRAIARATVAGRLAVVNPFGAVLPQNKRALAFCWEERHRFSPAARQAIDRYIPWTARLELADRAALLAQRELWVLKSDYGCEGEEVLVGAETPAETWREALAAARPGRWIVQRRFEALRDAAGQAVNFGVYLIAGRAAGLYARRSRLATDRGAVSVPVAVSP
jgi:Glutathionylspermidine synthase preATP-grasp